MRSCKHAAVGGAVASFVSSRWRRAAFAAALTVLAPAGASAQLFAPAGPVLPPGAVGLPPGAVRRIITGQGFRVLVPPFRNGDVYVVDVIEGRYGDQERLIVDAYEGTILRHIQVEARRRPPSDAVVGDRLPFPDEPSRSDERRSRYSRSTETPGRSGEGGDFSLFSRPSDEDPPREPRIVPGLGPDKPRPKRVVRPKAPPHAIVRATPLPPSEPKFVPNAEPKPVPAAVEPDQVEPARPPSRPGAAAVAKAPLPEVRPVPRDDGPPTAPAGRTGEAVAPARVPARDNVRRESRPSVAPEPATVAAIPPVAKPTEKAVIEARPVPKPAEAAASAKATETKHRREPLNDIPPAPLE